MMNHHLRNAVVAVTALTAGLLMTACQGDTGATSSGKDTAVVGKAADAKNTKGVNGSFKGGTVTFLAPGKYMVSVPGQGDQQFLVAGDTEVYGVGTICGEAGVKVDAPCTLDDLESATRKGAVNADVEVEDGIATQVTERRSTQPDSGSGSGTEEGSDSRETVNEGVDKGKGVSGTWFGEVRHLAPGKYTVSDLKGVEQQFLLAEDTEIWGYGDICGSTDTGEGGEGGIECTEGELEKAAKQGFTAEVVIDNGIATKITDDH
ncbi:hypothetical protein [Streptomyces sp. NPDC004976]